MSLLRLYLRSRTDKNDLQDIAIIYRYDDKEVYFSTGRKIHKDHWNPKSASEWVRRSYGGASDTFNMVLKKMLDEAEAKMNIFYLTNSRYPSGAEMKLLMGDKPVEKSFFALFDQFMLDRKPTVTTGTYNNYKKVKERFEKYQEHNKTPFGFHSINHSFYNHFTNYLIREYKSKVNTIGSYFRIFKTFIHWAELHHSVQIDKVVMANMRITMEENFRVWLSLAELEKLASLDFGDNKPLLTRSRDAFILLCCLGCRFGDFSKSVKENIITENGEQYFRIKTRKNKKLVQVPLSPLAKFVLDKYKGVDFFMWVPNMQDVNYQIKEACKLAGFVDMVEIVSGSGDNRKEVRVPRYQEVTTHTGKRTFINLLRHYGVDRETIRAMTGNSSRTIDTYMHPEKHEFSKAVRIFDSPAPESIQAGAPRQPEG